MFGQLKIDLIGVVDIKIIKPVGQSVKVLFMLLSGIFHGFYFNLADL